MVMSGTQQGRLRIDLDGEWEITDLEELVNVLRVSYSYFYWTSAAPGSLTTESRSLLERAFWSDRMQHQTSMRELYRRIPTEHRLRLGSIQKASPGYIELLGFAAIIALMARCAYKWLEVGEKAFDLFAKVDKYFIDRKLSPPPQRLDLDSFGGRDVDEARFLCFEFGQQLGFEPDQIERMINLTGNPISTLRYLVSLAREGRRLIQLEEAGKVKLPHSSSR